MVPIIVSVVVLAEFPCWVIGGVKLTLVVHFLWLCLVAAKN
jgi:hypothetical protein